MKDVPEQSISKEMIADLRLTSNFLDSYLIALEGWRRGLTVRWHSTVNHLLEYEDVFKLKPGQIFSLSTHNRTYNFMKALGDLNLGSINLVKNKDKTNEILKSYGINILEENSNLQTIVKKYHIYVTDNKVIGALSVEPSSITGDGIHTIQELIDRKNQLRKENPNYNRIIPIDDDFQKRLYTYGYYLDDILEKDTKLLLTDLSTIKLKEETYGIANEFPSISRSYTR